MNKCAIAILNWNGVAFLEKYLGILVRYTPENLATIYIIDNDSNDNSKEYIATNFPTVQWIQNDKNYGFAGGYNKGLEAIEEEILCLMNSDIEVTDHWIEPILSYFDLQKDMAALQPKILDLKKKTHFEYAGGSGGYYDKYGYAVCRGRYFDYIEEDLGQYNDIIDIFWASGCCIFVRNHIFKELEGFDSDYFAHQEEIDLCWRINNLGHRIVSFPQSTVYHYGGGSLPYGSYFKSYLNFRNSLFNLFKNLTKKQLLYYIPARLILDGVAAVHSVIKTRKILTLRSIWHAHIDFYKNIPKLISKRKKIKHKGYPKTTSSKLILIDYYIYKCRKYSELLH